MLMLLKSPRDRRASVGAAPPLVAAGAPGARGEVLAYADRIHDAWDHFWSSDFIPWVKSGAGKLKTGSAAEKDLIEQIRADAAAFSEYREEISSFNLFGPTPSEAWQALILHENRLKEDRTEFQELTGRSLQSKDPGVLEDEGGKEQPGIPWNGILVVAGLFAGAWALSSVASLAPRRVEAP